MFNLFRAQPQIDSLTVQEAYEQAKNGDLLIVDVRNPSEWMKSGLAEPAEAISMSDPNFLQRLEQLTGGDKDKKIGFICASGARSGQLALALKQYGWNNVYNILGGMFGTRSEPGWLTAGLPVKPWEG